MTLSRHPRRCPSPHLPQPFSLITNQIQSLTRRYWMMATQQQYILDTPQFDLFKLQIMTSNSRISNRVEPIKQPNLFQYRKMTSVPGPMNLATPKSSNSLQGFMPVFDLIDRDGRSTVRTPKSYRPSKTDKNGYNLQINKKLLMDNHVLLKEVQDLRLVIDSLMTQLKYGQNMFDDLRSRYNLLKKTLLEGNNQVQNGKVGDLKFLEEPLPERFTFATSCPAFKRLDQKLNDYRSSTPPPIDAFKELRQELSQINIPIRKVVSTYSKNSAGTGKSNSIIRADTYKQESSNADHNKIKSKIAHLARVESVSFQHVSDHKIGDSINQEKFYESLEFDQAEDNLDLETKDYNEQPQHYYRVEK